MAQKSKVRGQWVHTSKFDAVLFQGKNWEKKLEFFLDVLKMKFC